MLFYSSIYVRNFKHLKFKPHLNSLGKCGVIYRYFCSKKDQDYEPVEVIPIQKKEIKDVHLGISHHKDDPNDYPKIGDPDCDDIEKWKDHPNIKINPDKTMEIKNYLDPLYKRLPSYRTDLPLGLQGRLRFERERLQGMTDAERNWRAKWLKDQELSQEPVHVPELKPFLTNAFRRAWHFPLDFLFKHLILPIFGPKATEVMRYLIPRIVLYYLIIFFLFVWGLQTEKTWESASGPFMMHNKFPIYKPHLEETEQGLLVPRWKFADFGFSQRTLFRDVKLDRSTC